MDPHLLAPSLWWIALGTTILLVGYYTFCTPAIPGFNGPKGIPILGSFPFLTHYPELTLHRWTRRYGKIYSFRLGNQSFLSVSDPVIVKDLLVTNGAIFSSRKNMFIKAQTIFKGRAITGSPHGDIWRKHRRIAASYIQASAVSKFEATMNFEAMDMVKTLYQASQGGTHCINPQKILGRYPLNNMFQITFGVRTSSVDDNHVAEILRLSREFMNCTGPVSNLVDFIPFLQRLSTSMWRRGRKLQEDTVDFYGGMLFAMKANLQTGVEIPDCFAKTLLQIQEKEGLDHMDMTMLTAAYMIAGVETTAGVLQWFTAHIAAHPDIQRKAHEEMDRVVGKERVPDVDDEKNLPYCRAIIKEVERYHNPFWLGTPHMSTEDFMYRGNLIPANTVVVCDTYSMHFDADRYPDPFAFNPDRFMGDVLTSIESANQADPCKRDHWMYGVGRRICIGMALADRALFLGISRLLWSFTMEQVEGAPIDLKEYDGLSGRSPMPYSLKLTSRHEDVAKVLGCT